MEFISLGFKSPLAGRLRSTHKLFQVAEFVTRGGREFYQVRIQRIYLILMIPEIEL